MADSTKPKRHVSVWWFAFGYFAVYIPYSFFTKMVSGGLMAQNDPQLAAACAKSAAIADCPIRVNSFEWLPPTIIASICMMLIFITSMRWWKFATQTSFKVAGHTLPRPRIWTLLSGICTGLVVVTTTLAYTIDGVSIVFAMLLMRGGMLVMSPIVDTIFKRHVRWFSWAALGLSLAALLVSNFGPYAFSGKEWEGWSNVMNTMLAIDLLVYLSAYFCRLSAMSKLAKSDNADDTKKFFVEEQMVGTPSILVILFIASLFAPGVVDNPTGLDNMLNGIHAGFTTFWDRPASILLLAVAAGIFSQFNGVFGSLILLDKSENAYAVAVNRCSSILAGVIASLAIAIVFGVDLSGKALMPDAYTWVSAVLILGALVFLAMPKLLASKAKKAAELAGNNEDKKEEAKAEEKAEDAKAEEKAEDAKAE